MKQKATVRERVLQAMLSADMKARELFLINPDHKLISLLIPENEDSKEEEAHWDELSKMAYERFHVKLNLVKPSNYITLWKEIAQLLSEAVEAENKAKRKKHYETLLQEEKQNKESVVV